MMGLDERVAYLIIGGIIGFILGYIVRSLRDINQKEDAVYNLIKKDRDETGEIRKPTAQGVALFFVVCLTLFASVQSQMNSNEVEDSQDQQATVTRCTQSYLSQVLVAVNERTTYSRDQSIAAVELQRAQAEFIALALQDPPFEQARVLAGLTKYQDKLNKYVELVGKTASKQAANAYPTDEDFAMCISGKKEM